MTSLLPNDLFPIGSQSFFDQYLGDANELAEMFEEHRRRYTALLQHDGTPCKVLQLKISGARCPYWSDESHHCSKPLIAPKCFDTGWVGGYEAPVDMLVCFITPGTTRVWYENGVRVQKEARSWTLWRPLLKPNDVIVKARTGERFVLQNVTPVPPWREDLVLYQEFDLKLVTSEPVRFFGPSDGLVLTL